MRPHPDYSTFALIALIGLGLLIGVPVMQAVSVAPHRVASVSMHPVQAPVLAQPSPTATAEPLAIFIPTATTAPTVAPTAIAPATTTAFGCQPNAWALPVRDTTYHVVGTFGTKSSDSQYVQGLKAVGGVAQTANAVFHPGVDLRARMYSPVYAVADATIEDVAYNGQYGKHVRMSLAYPGATEIVTETLYGHLSDIFVAPGQRVLCGQVIAISGNSGVATLGPHLHFEVRRNGTPINPQRLLDALYAALPAASTRTGGTSP